MSRNQRFLPRPGSWLQRIVTAAPWLAVVFWLSGCTYTQRTTLAQPAMSNERLIEMALDPLRPVEARLSAARELDPAGQRELESRLLADLPALWGLEWRHRLALLGAVGGRAAMEELATLRDSGQLPELERVQAAIDSVIERIESRMATREVPATTEARADS